MRRATFLTAAIVCGLTAPIWIVEGVWFLAWIHIGSALLFLAAALLPGTPHGARLQAWLEHAAIGVLVRLIPRDEILREAARRARAAKHQKEYGNGDKPEREDDK